MSKTSWMKSNDYHIQNALLDFTPVPVVIDFIKSIQLIRRNMIRGTYYALQQAS